MPHGDRTFFSLWGRVRKWMGEEFYIGDQWSENANGVGGSQMDFTAI